MGPIKGQWLEQDHKEEILVMIDRAKQKGFSISRVCDLLMISRRRIVRWRNRSNRGKSLENLKPGPRKPLHTLLPMERDAVLHLAKEEKYADLSHRILAVTGWDLERFFVSFSSVYRIMRAVPILYRCGQVNEPIMAAPFLRFVKN